MEKYEWLPGVGAPESYPMEIYSGYFKTGDMPVNIPSGGILEEGWGDDGMTMGDGRRLKPAPHGFAITYFSLIENKFYTGDFELPFQKVSTLFKEGFQRSANNKWETFRSVIVGIAPGGMLVIWLGSADRQVEIGRYQAKETEIKWSSFNPSGEQDREVYVREVLADSPKALKNLEENGIQYGLYDGYRQKYYWKPNLILPEGFKVEGVDLKMFNAEAEYLWGQYWANNKHLNRAVPRKIGLIWYDEKGKKFGASINVNEEEVFTAFKEVFREDKELKGELVFELTSDRQNFTISVRNGKEEYELRKVRQGNYPMSR